MISYLIRRSLWLLCTTAIVIPACGSTPAGSEENTGNSTSDPSKEDESGDSNGDQSDSSTPSASASGSTSSGESESGDAGTDGTDSDAETQSETGTESAEAGSSEEGDTGAPKMNGELCVANEECESEQCNFSFGQGICSECVDDAACRESGKGLNCTRGDVMTTPWFVCGDGSLGEECMSDEGCMEKFACAEMELIGFSFCSECKEDKDCATDDKTLCVTKFSFGPPDPSDAGPHMACQAPGSLKSGDLCNLDTSGEEACEQHCAEPPMMFPLPAGTGFCGECRNDDDCEMGEQCKEASFGPEGIMGSMCEIADDDTTGDTTGETTGDTTTGDSETDTGDTGDTTTAYGEF